MKKEWTRVRVNERLSLRLSAGQRRRLALISQRVGCPGNYSATLRWLIENADPDRLAAHSPK